MTLSRNALGLRWTGANALGVLVGPGATFATIGLLSARSRIWGTAGVLVGFAIAILRGAIEATVVGLTG